MGECFSFAMVNMYTKEKRFINGKPKSTKNEVLYIGQAVFLALLSGLIFTTMADVIIR